MVCMTSLDNVISNAFFNVFEHKCFEIFQKGVLVSSASSFYMTKDLFYPQQNTFFTSQSKTSEEDKKQGQEQKYYC